MKETYLRQLQRTVEQAVRPVRASLSCKRRMREEMLNHLLAVYEQDIRRLKQQLEEAVAAEDYERAARLRDRIDELEPS